MRSDASSKSPEDLAEITVPQSLQAAFPEFNDDFQSVQDHFVVQGPNGDHRFLICPLVGPSIMTTLQSPSSRRLRRDLAVKVAKQTTSALHRMHAASLAHGDLTTSNVLFRFTKDVLRWSDDDVYSHFGLPKTEVVRTRDGSPREVNAPAKLVQPIEHSKIAHASLLEESVVLIDFGQSYCITSPPDDYEPATAMNYMSPEIRFDERTAGVQTDIWALGCAIFEIRAGFPLFDSFFGSDADILKQNVETLGRLPDPWWGCFEERTLWFEEDGKLRDAEAQKRDGIRLTSSKTSIREKLRSIGTQEDVEWLAGCESAMAECPMAENVGVKMSEEEVELLGDLLEKMLRYLPEERITIAEVMRHPWFQMTLE